MNDVVIWVGALLVAFALGGLARGFIKDRPKRGDDGQDDPPHHSWNH